MKTEQEKEVFSETECDSVEKMDTQQLIFELVKKNASISDGYRKAIKALQQNEEEIITLRNKKKDAIDFYARFYAEIQNAIEASKSQRALEKRLRNVLQASIFSFEQEFGVEFIKFSAGQKFNIDSQAKISFISKTGDLEKNQVITKCNKLAYKTENGVVYGKVELLIYDEALKNEKKLIEIEVEENTFKFNTPIYLSDSSRIKKALTIDLDQSYELGRRISLPIDVKTISAWQSARLWIGASGKNFEINPSEITGDLYFYVEARQNGRFTVTLLDDEKVFGRSRLRA